MSDFKPINTQEEFNTAIGERLRREKETVSKEFEQQIAGKDSEIAKYKTDMEALNKKLEEANQKIAGIPDLENKIKTYERASVKSKVAREIGIPDALADRLNGETEEDLRKDAESVRKLIGAAQPTAPLARTEDDRNASDGAWGAMVDKMRGE